MARNFMEDHGILLGNRSKTTGVSSIEWHFWVGFDWHEFTKPLRTWFQEPHTIIITIIIIQTQVVLIIEYMHQQSYCKIKRKTKTVGSKSQRIKKKHASEQCMFFVFHQQPTNAKDKHVLWGWRGIYKALYTLPPYTGPQKGFNHFSRRSKRFPAVLSNSGLQQLQLWPEIPVISTNKTLMECIIPNNQYFTIYSCYLGL